MLIKNLVKEKKEFLDGIDTNIDDENLKADKQRILNLKDNSKKIDNIIKMSENILKEETENNSNDQSIISDEKIIKNDKLEVEPTEVLLKKYEQVKKQSDVKFDDIQKIS